MRKTLIYEYNAWKQSRDEVTERYFHAFSGLPGNKLAQVWHFAHLDNGRSVMGAMDVLSFSTKAQLHSIWSHKKVSFLKSFFQFSNKT